MAGKQLKPAAFVNAVLKSFWKESGLEPRLLGSNNFRIKDAQKGRVDFELDINEDHINRMKTIHGGTLASMVDLGGSLAVASMGLYSTGVSTDLNGMHAPSRIYTYPPWSVTYLSSGGAPGDRLTGTATCDKIGKTLAYTTVVFQNAKGELAARGSHTKFVAKAWPTARPLFALPEGVPGPNETSGNY